MEPYSWTVLAGAVTGALAGQYLSHKHGDNVQRYIMHAVLKASCEILRREYENENPHIAFESRLRPLGLRYF